MSEKKSQLVITLNPQVLFTTLLGVAIIGFFTYISVTIPNKVTDISNNLDKNSLSLVNIEEDISGVAIAVRENTIAIRAIESTRFRDADAKSLSVKIIAEMKNELSPLFIDVGTLKKQMKDIDNKVNRNEEHIRNIRKD